jgi:ATP-binding cassette subfamily E protein 1
MLTYADVCSGVPGVDCTAGPPEGLLTGMNKFLKQLDITFRRDPENYRPRINKLDSQVTIFVCIYIYIDR